LRKRDEVAGAEAEGRRESEAEAEDEWASEAEGVPLTNGTLVTILSGLVYLVYVRLKEEGKMALVHQSLLLSRHLVWFQHRSNLLPVLGGQEINYCLNKKIFLRPQPEGVPPLPRVTEQRSGHPLVLPHCGCPVLHRCCHWNLHASPPLLISLRNCQVRKLNQ